MARLPPGSSPSWRKAGCHGYNRGTSRDAPVSYPELAERHGISADEVQAEFTTALILFMRTLREPEPWWWRLWTW